MSSNLESWSDGDSPVHPLSAVDFLPRPQLQAMQLYRLQGIVRWTYERVPLFRQRMDERGLKPKDIRELQDIEKLPFSQKADLHACYP
ncbi:MAG TPA: hypothetical protein PL064_14075, partial [Thermogutta sp.]|nr:hypothetical protein [Thermogutta sp.]